MLVQQKPKQTLHSGKLIGEHAVYGEPYPHSAVVSSPTVKLLSLGVYDYLEKFLHRSTTLERQSSGAGAGATQQDEEEGEDSDDLPDFELPRKLLEERKRRLRCRADLVDVKGKECTLRDAEPVKTRPPTQIQKTLTPTLLVQPGASGAVKEEREVRDLSLCYPGEVDLFPSVQRSATSMSHRSSGGGGGGGGRDAQASPSPSLRCGSACSGSGLLQASLDRRISRSQAATERLEAAHRSHVLYGYHVEAACGGVPGVERLASGPLVAAPQGSAVLMTCGSPCRTPRPRPGSTR